MSSGLCPLSLFLAGDQAGTTLECNIRPEPVEHHSQAIAEPKQQQNVNGTPKQPGKPATQLDAAELSNRHLTPDRRQIAVVAKAERWRLSSTQGPRSDKLTDIGALLLSY